LLISLIPGVLFFLDANSNEFIMPVRHKHTEAANVLEVAQQTYVDGGIMVPTMKDELFSGLKKIRLGVFYIPIFAHILFLLGFFVQINKYFCPCIATTMLSFI
jgi:hypothetical protein